VLFYVVSALGYRMTELTGIRTPRPARTTRAPSRLEKVSHM
jgi:hypothetical protein